jgi:hypothetical protein
MRILTRRIAGLEPGEWDVDAARVVTTLFDDLAPEWHTRTSPQRTEVVRDAMTRGLLPLMTGSGLCVEIGSGIGTYSSLLSSVFDTVLSAELSWEMISRAPPRSGRVLADGSRLPLADAVADAVVLINAFLFPDEVERVMKRGGAVVWVNSSGEETPIHLATAEVVAALPFDVWGVESRAGVGTWCVLRRV